MDVATLVNCGGSGGGGTTPGNFTQEAAAVGPLEGDVLYGWSLQNTSAGLSTVYLRFGDNDTATPYITINLAENETVTQIFPSGIPDTGSGFYFTVQTGTVDGLIYTG